MGKNSKPPFKRIHVIINPAAGQDRPILSILNDVFQAAGIDWEVFVTKKAGDARHFAAASVKAGVDVVAIHGGDGSVMEAASGLIGSDVPLAILPGGTANVMSVELGIPGNLMEAVTLASGIGSTLRKVDMGEVSGYLFMLRAGVGLEAQMVEGADRELKTRIGSLAYTLAALQALREPKVMTFRMRLDGQEVVSDGITCIVANSGNVGVPNLSWAPTIDVSDGVLDVIVIRKADLPSLIAVATHVVTGSETGGELQHWQAREITVDTDPPENVQVDGEIIGKTPITAKVIPQAIQVVVPATVKP
ncbi:MAG: diacylglycerol kinase family lipid kinase [Chloroflexi bacterium]|nr:diacylglycerol kinase family lipid kinase [Chloroflexota bacterium]